MKSSGGFDDVFLESWGVGLWLEFDTLIKWKASETSKALKEIFWEFKERKDVRGGVEMILWTPLKKRDRDESVKYNKGVLRIAMEKNS
ncbi:hypothetical protein Tco_1141599 [Tanacetum coccineum]